jgi:hypothetical protein
MALRASRSWQTSVICAPSSCLIFTKRQHHCVRMRIFSLLMFKSSKWLSQNHSKAPVQLVLSTGTFCISITQYYTTVHRTILSLRLTQSVNRSRVLLRLFCLYFILRKMIKPSFKTYCSFQNYAPIYTQVIRVSFRFSDKNVVSISPPCSINKSPISFSLIWSPHC